MGSFALGARVAESADELGFLLATEFQVAGLKLVIREWLGKRLKIRGFSSK